MSVIAEWKSSGFFQPLCRGPMHITKRTKAIPNEESCDCVWVTPEFPWLPCLQGAKDLITNQFIFSGGGELPRGLIVQPPKYTGNIWSIPIKQVYSDDIYPCSSENCSAAMDLLNSMDSVFIAKHETDLTTPYSLRLFGETFSKTPCFPDLDARFPGRSGFGEGCHTAPMIWMSFSPCRTVTITSPGNNPRPITGRWTGILELRLTSCDNQKPGIPCCTYLGNGSPSVPVLFGLHQDGSTERHNMLEPMQLTCLDRQTSAAVTTGCQYDLPRWSYDPITITPVF